MLMVFLPERNCFYIWGVAMQ